MVYHYSMKDVEWFISLWKDVIAEYKAGNITISEAAQKIEKQTINYTFEEPVHPMLYKVGDLMFDIAEDYRSEKEDKADWDTIIRTVEAYDSGNWEPTCWILSAMYGKYEKEKLIHSYSVAVKRQNGHTIIETASKNIEKDIKEVVSNVNKEQTDERYLQNLTMLMPKSIKTMKLVNVMVQEYLTEPYYSTH